MENEQCFRSVIASVQLLLNCSTKTKPNTHISDEFIIINNSLSCVLLAIELNFTHNNSANYGNTHGISM